MGIEPAWRLNAPFSQIYSAFQHFQTRLTLTNVIPYSYTVSSVHKLPGKPNWFCFYTDHAGRRRCKSTKTADKREAERVCNELQKVSDKARSGRLNADNARKVIESAVADIMEASGSPIDQKSIMEHFESWAKAREVESSEGTFKRYKGIVDYFLAFLGTKAAKPLPVLTSGDIERYRDSLTGKVSNATVNTHLKVLRVCLQKAVKQHIFSQNPARLVDNLDRNERHHRRAFTAAELRKLLEVASDDWKTAVLIGLYTGLRLSDAVNLAWSHVDLQKREIIVTEKKTNATQICPLAKPLKVYLESIANVDDPRAPLCPALAGKVESWLSNQFYELMAVAGLVKTRGKHEKKKSGRMAKREQSAITFHSLRHTATSLLKNAGVSDVVARDIIGHESEAVSRNYTHIDQSTRLDAVDKLPDFTK
jgi:integrase